MAAGGPPVPGPDEEKKGSLICTLCLEIFTCPKALPCLHTFCLKCLENLASHHPGSFHCPQCRHRVTVPSGGVADFPTNFHISSTDLARARNKGLCGVHPENSMDLARAGSKELCGVHPRKVMEYYCADCQEPVCSNCILTKHKLHDIKDLQEPANAARRQLEEEQGRVEEAVSYLTDLVDTYNRRQKYVWSTMAEMEKDIEMKYALLVSIADKCRDDALASLSKVKSDIDRHVTKDVECSEHNLDKACHLQEQLRRVISSGSDLEALEVAIEMKEGRGSTQALSKLKTAKRSSLCVPVLICKATEETIRPHIQDFFGTVEEMKKQVTQLEDQIRECEKNLRFTSIWDEPLDAETRPFLDDLPDFVGFYDSD